MAFYNYKKIFAGLGIMAILLPVIFLSAPKKAEAIVPVIDAANLAVNTAAATSLATLVTKEFSLDSIAYLAAKVVLRSLTTSVVNWIKSGFQGNPLFIQDLEANLADAADQATGAFMKEFLSPEVYNAICTPFRAQLVLALKSSNTYAERMRCTLNTVVNNVDNFFNNFRQGGWRGWISMTASPQNNPYGALLTSLDELKSRQLNAKSNAQTESIFNKGFLSMKKCTEYYDNQWTGEYKCTKYENTSPGAWVSDQLSSATGIDFKELALADELNEIIAALASYLTSQLMSGIAR